VLTYTLPRRDAWDPLAGNELASQPVAWGEVLLNGLALAGLVWVGAEVCKQLFGRSRQYPVRDTYRYQLFAGRTKVQSGITNDPARRCPEHVRAGKQFGAMRIIGPPVTKEAALAWERADIQSYQQRKGRRPRYNKI